MATHRHAGRRVKVKIPEAARSASPPPVALVVTSGVAPGAAGGYLLPPPSVVGENCAQYAGVGNGLAVRRGARRPHCQPSRRAGRASGTLVLRAPLASQRFARLHQLASGFGAAFATAMCTAAKGSRGSARCLSGAGMRDALQIRGMRRDKACTPGNLSYGRRSASVSLTRWLQ
ncbi:hypothetical protein HPP92_006835 [Vanilla planifolia]|uniref:Uncharacterized protein n=1 Tax=Vanilla planifolia TaxID=51239 RepID=A0A835RQ01_VANPL|nr:hypothetical protein HPP92_006835 [Vanilla planifolia]